MADLRGLKPHEAVYLSGEFVSKDSVDDLANELATALAQLTEEIRRLRIRNTQLQSDVEGKPL